MDADICAVRFESSMLIAAVLMRCSVQCSEFVYMA
jgi:hypothetical protein